MQDVWQYSTVHNIACKVIEEQILWGQTVCRVWLPNQNAVVRVPRSALRSLNTDLQPEIEAGRIAYVAAAAKVAEMHTHFNEPFSLVSPGDLDTLEKLEAGHWSDAESSATQGLNHWSRFPL